MAIETEEYRELAMALAGASREDNTKGPLFPSTTKPLDAYYLGLRDAGNAIAKALSHLNPSFDVEKFWECFDGYWEQPSFTKDKV